MPSVTYDIFLLGGRDFVCRRFGTREEVRGWEDFDPSLGLSRLFGGFLLRK